MARCGVVLVLLAFVGGCVHLPELNNEMQAARSLTTDEGVRMREEPQPLSRPLVILGGYRTVPLHATGMGGVLTQLSSGRSADVLVLSFPMGTDMDAMAARTIAAVERRWPSGDPERTVPVDVVGVCMGGVLARWAAIPAERRIRAESGDPPQQTKQLQMARLFTISAPHQGTSLPRWVAPDQASRDMRSGSGLLRTLDAELPQGGYELVCYAQRNDPIVGVKRAAPPGYTPIESAGTIGLSHLSAASNRVFLVDIARRLRNEPPLVQTGTPPSGGERY
jgi:hypothetical protein